MTHTAGTDFEDIWKANGRHSDTFTAAELMAEEMPPVRSAVPGLITEGVFIFASKPKLGKSWMAFGLGVAVSAGRSRGAAGDYRSQVPRGAEGGIATTD